MEKQVFVIGAGASADLGMPIGSGLIKTISTFSNSMLAENRGRLLGDEVDSVIRHNASNLLQRKFPAIDPQAVAAKLASGLWLATSIDNYLNEQSDLALEALGKFLISTSILFHEKYAIPEKNGSITSRKNTLYSAIPCGDQPPDFSSLRETWMVPFFRMMRRNGSIEDFIDRLDSTTMIIFNYDRCFEHFFHSAIKTYHGVGDREANEIFGHLNIIHPYGVIGKLPWQAPRDEAVISFGDFTYESARLFAQDWDRIRTFSEAASEGLRDEARAAIRVARRVVFLGFGYLRANLDFLGKGVDLSVEPNFRRDIYGTAFGLSENRIEKVRNSIKPFSFGDSRSNLRNVSTEKVWLMSSDSSELIEEHGDEWFPT